MLPAFPYEVTLLANLPKISDSKLRLLTGGISATIYDCKKTYTDLVFPIVSETYYNYSELNININLNNKSPGGKINYSVETELGTCDITVVFIPLIEIGKLMYRYRNSILKYNPRSYLTLKEGSINNEIRQTIIDKSTNEFALYNNGITILSDETFFKEKIGQKDKAQLGLKNPQIINGGQTAFTSSLIYEESLQDNNDLFEKLDSKEVLVKIITFSLLKEIPIDKKLELIEAISKATNKQNLVNTADRSSNNPLLVESQKSLFTDFGFLLERKRGEFFDGLRYGYLERKNIIDRGIFMRIAFACLGHSSPPQKEKKLLSQEKLDFILNDKGNFKRYFFGCLCYSEIINFADKKSVGQAGSTAIFSVIAICVEKYFIEKLENSELKDVSIRAVNEVLSRWTDFENFVTVKFYNSHYFKFLYNYNAASYKFESNFSKYYRSANLAVDLNDFFATQLIENQGLKDKLITIEKHIQHKSLDVETIQKVEPLINKANWYDEKVKEAIAEKYKMSVYTVTNAIKLITSRDAGYYVSKFYQITLPSSLPIEL